MSIRRNREQVSLCAKYGRQRTAPHQNIRDQKPHFYGSIPKPCFKASPAFLGESYYGQLIRFDVDWETQGKQNVMVRQGQKRPQWIGGNLRRFGHDIWEHIRATDKQMQTSGKELVKPDTRSGLQNLYTLYATLIRRKPRLKPEDRRNA
jgi:hypothetical protein